jgi:inner membrane protein
MPTTIAHTIAGYAAGDVTGGRRARPWWVILLLALLLANLPDVDFLPGLLMGDARAFHRGATHTLLAAVVVGVVFALVAGRRERGYGRAFVFAFALYSSHLVLDAITPDTSGLAGIQLFWPFSDVFVSAPIPLPPAIRTFIDLRLGDGGSTFFSRLLSLRAIAVFLVDGLIFAPLLLVPYALRRSRAQATSTGALDAG